MFPDGRPHTVSEYLPAVLSPDQFGFSTADEVFAETTTASQLASTLRSKAATRPPGYSVSAPASPRARHQRVHMDLGAAVAGKLPVSPARTPARVLGTMQLYVALMALHPRSPRCVDTLYCYVCVCVWLLLGTPSRSEDSGFVHSLTRLPISRKQARGPKLLPGRLYLADKAFQKQQVACQCHRTRRFTAVAMQAHRKPPLCVCLRCRVKHKRSWKSLEAW